MDKIIRKISISRFKNRIYWFFLKKKLGKIGKNGKMGINGYISNPQSTFIGDNFVCGENCKFMVYVQFAGHNTGMVPKICIGDNVAITSNCFFSCINEISIGNGTLIGNNVLITDNFHGKNKEISELLMPPKDRKLWSKGKIKIGNNVWIGSNVTILPDVKIGDGVIIGANSVITHDIPEYSTVAGIPAREINRLYFNGDEDIAHE